MRTQARWFCCSECWKRRVAHLAALGALWLGAQCGLAVIILVAWNATARWLGGPQVDFRAALAAVLLARYVAWLWRMGDWRHLRGEIEGGEE